MAAGLNIAALAKRTGIPPDTLRKWEQRYHILQPDRTAGGQRRYSERDVARVQWLRDRLAQGYRIGEAARLLGTAGVEPARSAADHLGCILEAVDGDEPAEIGIRLDQAFALLELDETLSSVLEPLLQRIGDRWEDGSLSVASEHLVSEAIRSRLGHLLSDAGGGVHGTAVLACAPDERHELGLMMTAIALRRDGWKVVYLGPNTPLADAVELAGQVAARLLGLSVAMDDRVPGLEDAVRATPPPDELQLVIGGQAASPRAAQRLGALYGGPDLRRSVAAIRALAA